MSYLQITQKNLADLGNYSIQGRYILILRRKMHVRLDQVRFRNGALSMQFDGMWNYRVSSFHVKIDASHDVSVEKVWVSKGFDQRTGQELFKPKKIKTIEDWSDYLYFKYVDGGVWQPVWGYAKFDSQTGGQKTNSYRSDLPSGYWGDLMSLGREFIEALEEVTGTTQGLACGPVQESQANLFGQL